MRRSFTVSAIQMKIEPENSEVNLRTIERLVRGVFVKGKSDLIVLPELSIMGPLSERMELVLDESSDEIGFFRKLASKYDTYIVSGTFIEKVRGKYYNTSLLIDNKGGIILKYQKNNLFVSERERLTAGEEIDCVDTPLGRIGIIICWDIAFPETSRKLARKGVDIICCPSYWTVDQTGFLERHKAGNEKIYVNTLCPARAIENEVLFIYANGAGEAKGFEGTREWRGEHIGQSQICVPIAGTVARMEDNSEGVVSYTYDRQIVEDAEKIFKIREDLSGRLKM